MKKCHSGILTNLSRRNLVVFLKRMAQSMSTCLTKLRLRLLLLHEKLNFSIVGEQKGLYQLVGSPEDLKNPSNYIGPMRQFLDFLHLKLSEIIMSILLRTVCHHILVK